ncbi:hypothetical protein LZ31DRAFT_43541 [Colletotrichum somersetense]|nr:hypothetical protein LZ31DRAFT_43541 [Colletotrichum somersetense]
MHMYRETLDRIPEPPESQPSLKSHMVGAYDGPSSLVLAPVMRDITIIPMAPRVFSRSPYWIGHRTQLPSSPHRQATQATEAHHTKGLGPRHGSMPRVRRHLILLLKSFLRPSHCNLREDTSDVLCSFVDPTDISAPLGVAGKPATSSNVPRFAGCV